jgi:steroid delta-isomerase-like uncharacterized protein
MSTETNKAMARRVWEEIFSRGNLAVADEIFSANFIDSGPATLPGLPQGPESIKIIVSVYRNAFPDLNITVDEQFAEDDKVVTRWTSRGTHLGELAGIPPTGKSVSISGVSIDRFAGGLIVESWGIFDQYSMLQQLGVIPKPG